MINKDDIKRVWDELFGDELQDNEYVEVDYDAGDNNFNMALYIQDINLLYDLLETGSGKSNFAIHYTTKVFPNKRVLLKRSSKNNAYRCKAVIVDFEPRKKKLLKELEFSSLYEAVNTFLDQHENIKKAVSLVGYTGGGGQLYIRLSRWVEREEMEQVIEYLKAILTKCPYVDPSTFNVAQGQRLLGTYSVKWKTMTHIVHDFSEDCVPLDVDMVLSLIKADKNLKSRINTSIQKTEEAIGNIREIVKQIKQKVKFKDLGYEGYYKGSYSKLHCPFHPPDNNPSFVVYHQDTEGNPVDVGIDMHDGQGYDVISFYMAINNVTFIEALKALAKKAGIKLNIPRKKLRELKVEEKIEDFDYEGYLRDELCIRDIVCYKTEDGLHFEFKLEDAHGIVKTVSMSARKIEQFSQARREFFAYTYKLPARVEAEVWDAILEYMVQKATKPEDEEEYDRSSIKYEVDFIERVIYNSEGTTDPRDFYENKYTKYFHEDGKTYLNLPRLLVKVSGSPILQKKTIQHLTTLLRLMGAKPTNLRLTIDGSEKSKRCWLLPDDRDWRNLIDETVVEQATERVTDVQSDIFEGNEEESSGIEGVGDENDNINNEEWRDDIDEADFDF